MLQSNCFASTKLFYCINQKFFVHIQTKNELLRKILSQSGFAINFLFSIFLSFQFNLKGGVIIISVSQNGCVETECYQFAIISGID